MLALFRVCGFLYIVSSLWCVLQMDMVTAYLGFQLLNNVAQSEFITVYGGMQMGIGLAMLLTSLRSDYMEAGLFFSMVFSLFLAFYRLVSFFMFDMPSSVLPLLVLECAIAMVLCIAMSRMRAR